MKLSEILGLFKEESYEKRADYELVKTDTLDGECFWNFVIFYYTNYWGYTHNEPNELEIVIDNDKKIIGIEFESGGDRVSRSDAWKSVCKCVANDLVFEIDLKEKVKNNE